MTKTEFENQDGNNCEDCQSWQSSEYELPKRTGLCTCSESDHFGHILIHYHPCCSEICQRDAPPVVEGANVCPRCETDDFSLIHEHKPHLRHYCCNHCHYTFDEQGNLFTGKHEVEGTEGGVKICPKCLWIKSELVTIIGMPYNRKQLIERLGVLERDIEGDSVTLNREVL